jgi:acylpyruvate hydrolase
LEIFEMKNIWAVGRNYEEHAKELGNAPAAAGTPPLIFLKSGGTVVPNSREIHLPSWSNDIHHEAEIALRLKFGSDQKLTVDAFTIALDLTARDIQAQLKKNGQPWTLAKSFKESCPLGDWVSTSKLGRTDDEILKALGDLEFTLKVNDQQRQHGFTRDMVHRVENLLAYIAERFPVQDGDVLLTGTPAGVAALKAGDQIVAEIIGFTKANWKIA